MTTEGQKVVRNESTKTQVEKARVRQNYKGKERVEKVRKRVIEMIYV